MDVQLKRLHDAGVSGRTSTGYDCADRAMTGWSDYYGALNATGENGDGHMTVQPYSKAAPSGVGCQQAVYCTKVILRSGIEMNFDDYLVHAALGSDPSMRALPAVVVARCPRCRAENGQPLSLFVPFTPEHVMRFIYQKKRGNVLPTAGAAAVVVDDDDDEVQEVAPPAAAPAPAVVLGDDDDDDAGGAGRIAARRVGSGVTARLLPGPLTRRPSSGFCRARTSRRGRRYSSTM